MTIQDTLKFHRNQLQQAEQFAAVNDAFLNTRPDTWLSLGCTTGARFDFEARDVSAIVHWFGPDGWHRTLNGLRTHYHFIKQIGGVEIRICDAQQANLPPEPVQFTGFAVSGESPLAAA